MKIEQLKNGPTLFPMSQSVFSHFLICLALKKSNDCLVKKIPTASYKYQSWLYHDDDSNISSNKSSNNDDVSRTNDEPKPMAIHQIGSSSTRHSKTFSNQKDGNNVSNKIICSNNHNNHNGWSNSNSDDDGGSCGYSNTETTTTATITTLTQQQ